MTSHPSGIVREVQNYVDQHLDRWIEFLRELTLAESPSLVPESQHRVFEILRQPFEEMHFEISQLAGRQSGGLLRLTSPGGSNERPQQLLLGHCDTVWPLGTLERMPVEIDAQEGTLKGPGVYDMKAGLTQIAFALMALHDLGLEPEVAPAVLINSDEEIGSTDSEPYIRRLAKKSNRVFVLEPSLGRSGQLKTARKGIGQFKVTVKGKAAHAGLEPEGGASAILELSYVIQKLFQLNDPERGITVNVGTIDGGLRPNVIAPESTASVDVRVVKEEDAHWVESQILNLKPTIPNVRLEVEGLLSRPPLERTPRNQALWGVASRLGRKLGLELEEGLAGGASDGNLTSLYSATLDGLGAVGGGAHALHEFIYIDKLAERTALLALLLLEPPLDKEPHRRRVPSRTRLNP